MSGQRAGEQGSARVMLGVCADDAYSGIQALKAWVTELQLPKGPLHGMDREGVPLDMSTFGAVYIKYNSLPTGSDDPPGTAVLSGYNGGFRGIYFNPVLPDGEFRQYAVLPLDLFAREKITIALEAAAGNGKESENSMPSAGARVVSAVEAGSNTRSRASELDVNELQSKITNLPSVLEMVALGIGIHVLSSDDKGTVRLQYEGPPKLRRAVEMQIRNELRQMAQPIRSVEFVESAEASETS